jgi:putative N6-adenine-specific DNA methylase
MAPTTPSFDIFLACAPGLEEALRQEASTKGFKRAEATGGGVTIRGGWPEVWRANLWLRGANTVIARVATFRAEQLRDLEVRARGVSWGGVLRPDVTFRVEASCAKSRIYHSGAVVERVADAVTRETGAPFDDDAPVTVMVRIERDACQIGIDTSGDLLHKRGFKAEVGKAPMRETVAAALLRMCDYDGREPVLDPMCGSGTFIIEAAEIAAGLNPGRVRRFAFEQLATFDSAAWAALRAKSATAKSDVRCHGSDRDAGAIRMSRANADRAGVSERTAFEQKTVSEITPPAGQPGLVIVNPPYGDRIGEKGELRALYRALGTTLSTRFSGWRVGLVATDAGLVRTTGLPFAPPSAPIAHGGLKIRLWRTGRLP